ncbi:Ig-like domain-containing protein [Puia sp.]|jgi:hypothetical protein|uniref:Ig-like domain-containing protein n=1 Tax=Puia sp. TaxID=2045100 RepID=UPI002F3F150B
MKRNLLTVSFTVLSALLFQPLFAAPAATIDNFNSRPGVRLTEVKGYLQGKCWFFSDFDINRAGWIPNIEGDGAMVSGTGASATERTGIYTPLLDLTSATVLSFTYSFNQPVKDRRWIRVVAIDGNNNPVATLDSLEMTGSEAGHVYSYKHPLNLTGSYGVCINYRGTGGATRIAIDELTITAAPHYASTCNVAPVSLKDKFSGTASHTAAGNVLSNDYDPNHETMTAYLMTESQDGQVQLQKDGSFVFTPKDGFTGNSTQFTYKICDNGSPALCSINTTATIRFPNKSSLVGFEALYSRKEVALNWNTAGDNHSRVFEIERSLDGEYYKKVGEVKAEEAVAVGQYTFNDKMHEQERKNDLYYRLRQVDGNNKVTYSKVLILRSYGTRSVAAVSVTPDPNINDIQVNVQLKEKSFVMVRVTDNNGSELIKQSAMGDFGSNVYNIEGTSNLQPGMYQLEVIINSNERLTMKLAKS